MGKRSGRRVTRILCKAAVGFVGSTVFLVLLYRFVPVFITPLMLIRCVEQLSAGEKLHLRHNWVPMEAISRNLSLAVVCSEDQRFLEHFGFDLKAIERSVQAAERGAGRLRGASTISQQTAKNVFLWPQRSWLRKGLEVYFTVLIETFWSKERILEVYLNSIEMGNGIYGAEAASRYYFKKSARHLSKRQAAAIAAILPNPLRYRISPPTPYIRGRISWILGQMNHLETLKFD